MNRYSESANIPEVLQTMLPMTSVHIVETKVECLLSSSLETLNEFTSVRLKLLAKVSNNILTKIREIEIIGKIMYQYTGNQSVRMELLAKASDNILTTNLRDWNYWQK